ncbi:TPA: hypothetical protein DEG21_05990 [Patescibacteria group bacterium]|nr:hypothetical protein [Candidatus Gracilibacteria bacterium]
MLSILTKAAFLAQYFVLFISTCFFTSSSALSCNSGSIEVYIFNHPALSKSFQYLFSRNSFT